MEREFDKQRAWLTEMGLGVYRSSSNSRWSYCSVKNKDLGKKIASEGLNV